MSLVNNMLRDLEDRQDTREQPAGVSPALSQRKKPASRGSKLSLTIGLCLFASAAGFLTWHNNGGQEATTVELAAPVTQQVVAKEPKAQAPKEPEPAAPATIAQQSSQPVETHQVPPQPADRPTPVTRNPKPVLPPAEQAPEPQTTIAASSATENRQAIQTKARNLLAQGDLAGAAGQLESIQPSLSQHPDHYALLAGIYHKQGQHQQAAELYNQLVQIERDNAIYWLGLAVALDAMQDRNALRAFQTTRQLNNNPDVAAYVEQRIQQLNKSHRKGA
ncbi:hypothetical protein ACVBEJ_07560 [Porticoccus sp. GXU_MW_L64]